MLARRALLLRPAVLALVALTQIGALGCGQPADSSPDEGRLGSAEQLLTDGGADDAGDASVDDAGSDAAAPDAGSPLGTTCSQDDECGSGHCVDTRCCDTLCTGQCEACDVAGSEGTCTAVTGSPHGSRTDCTNEGATCGGSCDGSNTSACTYPTSSTTCGAASCTGGVETHAATCDGSGDCAAPSTASCGAYACGATACKTSCSTVSDCASGNYCDAGVCKPQSGLGNACGSDSQCGSGHCVDGFCCNAACNGQCEACDNPNEHGLCLPVAAGDAPHNARTACTTDGTCGGACDGSNNAACDYPATSCRSASCSGGVETVAASCSDGTCPALVTNACAPYVCGATACKTSCSSNGDCTSANFCSLGSCVPKKSNGGTCSNDNQCSGGQCVDGYCCNSACDGQCEACDVAGSAGTCTAVPAGQAPHGARAACTGTGTTCGGTCGGVVTTQCKYPTVECRAASCANGKETHAASCSNGSCPAVVTATCDPYVCGPTACKTSCGVDGDCLSTHYCGGGNVCTPKLAAGDSCATGNQCETGLCTDGVCCGGTCDGQCEACNVAGHEGSCYPVTGAPVNGRPACATDGSSCGGTCNGVKSSACTYPSGTVCVESSCSTSTLTNPRLCNGVGTCLPETTTDCGEYLCSKPVGQPAFCRTSCSLDAHCVSADYCVNPGNSGVCSDDADADGIPNSTENQIGTNPKKKDTDGDFIDDALEVGYPDPGWPLDTDCDGLIDAIDSDSDNDSINDVDEKGNATLALPPVDTDGDGAPDFRDVDTDADNHCDGPCNTQCAGACDGICLADGAGVNGRDNCLLLANDQADVNMNDVGDACDCHFVNDPAIVVNPDDCGAGGAGGGGGAGGAGGGTGGTGGGSSGAGGGLGGMGGAGGGVGGTGGGVGGAAGGNGGAGGGTGGVATGAGGLGGGAGGNGGGATSGKSEVPLGGGGCGCRFGGEAPSSGALLVSLLALAAASRRRRNRRAARA
jgi:hypothetical protein